MQQGSEALSLEQVLSVIRRRVLLIGVCCLVVAGAALGFSKHQTKKYTATAVLVFGNNQLGQQVAGLSVANTNDQVAQQSTNLKLVQLGDTAAKTARLLGDGLTEEKVSDSVSVAVTGETNFVEVSIASTSPTLAAAIANTYVEQFVKEQQSANRRLFRSALVLVNKQLAELSPAQRSGADGLELQDRAHTLGLLVALGSNNVQVAQEAVAPSSPSSPKTKRNTLLGAVVGLLLGFGLAFLLERIDRRIREPEELEAIYRLPVLGIVPKSTALSRSRKGKVLPPTEAEAFSLIRAHLRFFNIDRELRMLVIASPASGDGKSTIARYLAEAAARSGSRVLLLEVDLRHPTLAQQLDVMPGPGLADVLIGAVPIDQATQSVELHAPSGTGAKGHTLEVLAAGSVLPPNPGELLESDAMGSVIEQAKSAYDLVVIDTPPLTAVSDAFPLLTKVDGVVVVGRIGHSRRDAAEQLHQVLAGSGAPLLGVIANGAKSGGPSPYPAGRGSAPTAPPADGASPSEEFTPTARA